MKKYLPRIISAAGYLLIFCGYSYVLFTNLAISFSLSVTTRSGLVIALLLALIIGIGFPAAVCIQNHKISKMEEQLELLSNALEVLLK